MAKLSGRIMGGYYGHYGKDIKNHPTLRPDGSRDELPNLSSSAGSTGGATVGRVAVVATATTVAYRCASGDGGCGDTDGRSRAETARCSGSGGNQATATTAGGGAGTSGSSVACAGTGTSAATRCGVASTRARLARLTRLGRLRLLTRLGRLRLLTGLTRLGRLRLLSRLSRFYRLRRACFRLRRIEGGSAPTSCVITSRTVVVTTAPADVNARSSSPDRTSRMATPEPSAR